MKVILVSRVDFRNGQGFIWTWKRFIATRSMERSHWPYVLAFALHIDLWYAPQRGGTKLWRAVQDLIRQF